MKKFITFCTVCVIASVFFSSCSSNLSIAKRHFNNGYYIAYSKSKPVVRTTTEEDKVVQTKTKESFYAVQNKREQNSIDGYSDQSTITGNNEIVASNDKAQHKAISKRNIKQTLKQQIKIIEYPATQVKHSLFETKKINNSARDEDGLSFFWVVILIILILWALGYWGFFGLVSGLINLLLLVALILLILWLLRVI